MIPFPLLALIAAFAFCSASQAKDYHVYLMAGQSNMVGYGYVSDLPAAYQRDVPGAFIFHGNTGEDGAAVDGRGLWAPLRPGHGIGFASDGESNQLSDRFGPELSFARQLQAESPGAAVAIIKYARGGTALDALSQRNAGKWDPHAGGGVGVNQYDHCLATIRRAFAPSDIDGDGEADRLIPAGIVWMQGETDGEELGPAIRYAENLRELMTLFRAALHIDDAPVVIGRITDSGQDEDGLVWDFGNVVRAQQFAYSASDARAALVTSTDDYAYSDKWHYDSAGFIDLGERFADAMTQLQE